jgi:putative nucleotidyltransferase with HDIG domain
MGLKYGSRSSNQRAAWQTTAVPPTTAGDLHLPEVRLLHLMDQLEPEFREVVRRALFDGPGRFEKFASAPASANGHHRARGGNILHTVEVAEMALMVASYYGSLVDKQIVLTSALLHDLGKCEEYDQTARGTFMSEAGQMVGHKTIGAAIVWAALEPLHKTSTKRALAVMNAVASSSGRSFDLRGPSTFEAAIVNKADQLSAEADLYRESLRNCGNNYIGIKHPHMQERPRHPVALRPVTKAASAPTQLPRLTRSQRFPDC